MMEDAEISKRIQSAVRPFPTISYLKIRFSALKLHLYGNSSFGNSSRKDGKPQRMPRCFRT